MTQFTWDTRELLLLQAIAAADDVPVDAEELAETVEGLEHESLMRVLRSLARAEYIEATLVEPDQTDYPVRVGNSRLTERGKVAVGAWPSEAAAGERFLRAVEPLVESENDPVKRTRLQALPDAAQTLGASVLSTVLSQAASDLLRHLSLDSITCPVARWPFRESP